MPIITLLKSSFFILTVHNMSSQESSKIPRHETHVESKSFLEGGHPSESLSIESSNLSLTPFSKSLLYAFRISVSKAYKENDSKDICMKIGKQIEI